MQWYETFCIWHRRQLSNYNWNEKIIFKKKTSEYLNLIDILFEYHSFLWINELKNYLTVFQVMKQVKAIWI